MDGQILLLSGLLFHVIFLMLFGYLYRLEKKRCMLLWALSWLFFLSSSILIHLPEPAGFPWLLPAFGNIFLLLGVLSLTQGALVFFRGKTAKWMNVGAAMHIVYFVLAGIFTAPEIHTAAALTLFPCWMLFYTGIVSIRTDYVKSALRYWLGSLFILWALGMLLLLRHYPEGEGYLIALSVIGLASIGTSVCLQLVYFLHNRQYQDQLDRKIRYSSTFDGLTGVFNRAFCEERIKELDNEEHLPLSILFGDLNNLKLINDIFGHPTGDTMIRKTANIIKTSVNDGLVGRWGGDEFIVILPGTGYDQAVAIMEEIHRETKKQKTETFPLDIALGAATKETSDGDLQDIINQADQYLYDNKFKDSKESKKALVEFFKKMMFEKVIETRDHVLRVQQLSLAIGEKMKLSKRELEEISMVALLHDIGKISIPKNILNKPGKLTPEEWLIMKRHCEIGYRILMSSDEFVHLAPLVLSHHENWDGTGYPQNQEGKDIPQISRIISIVDAYDAMVNYRVYKKTLSKEEALAEIEACAGSQFDPYIVNIFVKLMREAAPRLPALDTEPVLSASYCR